MNPHLKPYRLLVAIAEEKSFSRAAQRLHVAQPWVSAQIRRWEEEAGFPLFVRSNHPTAPVMPTEQGRELVAQAQRIVEEADRFQAIMKGLQADTLPVHIGTDPLTGQIPERIAVIDRVLKTYPDIPLQFHNMDDEQTLELMQRRQMDAGLIIGQAPDPQVFRSKSLCKLRVELLIPRENPLAELPSIAREHLRDQPMLICTRATHPISASVLAFWRSTGARVTESPDPHVFATTHLARRQRVLTTTFLENAAASWGLTDMVQRPFDDLPLYLDLMLVILRGPQRRNIEKLWSCA